MDSTKYGTITQERYQEKIKKQQSLLRKLLASRKRRLEEMEEATYERYGHLIGRFLCLDAYTKDYCCISGFRVRLTKDDDDVLIDVVFRRLNFNVLPCYTLEIGTDTLTFNSCTDIESKLASRFALRADAVARFNELVKKLAVRFGIK